jgi:branched-chain amino acid transport system ATP-binding protein
MLEVDNVEVFRGDIKAIWNVSLRVGEGELVSIIGSNGAGKSTLINAISGLLPVKSGSIRFLGRRIENEPPHRIVEYGIVQVPEGRQIFPEMTVMENLEVASVTPEAKKARRDSLKVVFDLFPVLKERRTQLAGTLSGGEQQMLAIARGLMAKPKLLMFDEPSLGLAPTIVKRIFEVIKEINENGVTVLLVEQNVYEALSICHRGYVLENGRIVLEGSGEELLANEQVKRAYLGL